MPRRHVLLALAVAVVWGVNFVVIDVGLDSFPPLLFAALRFTVTALPLVFFVRRPPIAWHWIILVGTFLSAGQFGLLFVAMDRGLPPGLASLVIQLQALFTIALAVAFLGERPRRGQLAGAALALTGIGVIAAGRSAGVPLAGLGLCVGAAASWGVGNVCTRLAQAPDGFALMVWSSLVPPIPLFLLSLALEGPGAAGFRGVGWGGRRPADPAVPPLARPRGPGRRGRRVRRPRRLRRARAALRGDRSDDVRLRQLDLAPAPPRGLARRAVRAARPA